jgi:1,4-alpha-glucan branching enzyme
VGNFSPLVRENHRLGLPRAGEYRVILNTAAEVYGDSGAVPVNSIVAEETPFKEQAYSALLTLPPLATLWFEVPKSKS